MKVEIQWVGDIPPPPEMVAKVQTELWEMLEEEFNSAPENLIFATIFLNDDDIDGPSAFVVPSEDGMGFVARYSPITEWEEWKPGDE